MEKNKYKKDFLRIIPLLFLILSFILPVASWIFITKTSLNFKSFIKPPFLKQFLITGFISALTSILSVFFAYAIALLWWLTKKTRFSILIIILVFFPIILGLLTRNYAWIGILSKTDFEYTFSAVILVMLYIFIPFAFFILIQGFSAISDFNIQSSNTMGATAIEVFYKVVLPLTRRHIFISLFFVFTNSLCYYITPAMIGGGKFDMIGNIIWQFVNLGRFDDASGIAIIFMVYVCCFFLLTINLIIKRR